MGKVAIVVGSKNDLELIEGAKEILNNFEVEFDVFVLSAHRTLDDTISFAENAEKNGYEVIIAAAGMAAHLPGIISAKTILPVIGVPLPTSDIKGVDALLSIVQMPTGVPVATMSIGKAGVKNAALFSIEILARNNEKLKEKLIEYKKNLK